MNEFSLKKLEEKYWQGETSLEEESRLKGAVKKNPEFFSPYLVDLFSSLESDSSEFSQTLDESFDEKFWSSVESKDSNVIRLNFKKYDFIRVAAAAVVVIAMGLGLWYGLEEGSTTADIPQSALLDDTYESPEVAFEEAKKALSFASEKLNKGAAPIGKIKKFHQATMSVTGVTNISNDTTRNHEH